MSKAVAVTRTELDAAGLRRAASRERDAAASRRMLAIASVLEGVSRTDAARSAGMDRQTLRDWAIRYNEEGLPGLRDQAGEVGPRRRLSPSQETSVAEWVRRGPDPVVHGVVRWRRADLARVIAERFGVVLAERSRHRAAPPRLSPSRRAAAAPGPRRLGASVFQRDFPALVKAVLPPEAAGKPVEVWWQMLWGRTSSRPGLQTGRRP